MFEFSHDDLDGRYNSVIGRGSILQLIDPNDNAASRWQITAVDDMLFQRRLPASDIGDIWRGESAIRQWESIDIVPQWSLIEAWWQSQLGYDRDSLAAIYASRLRCGLPIENVTKRTLSVSLDTITTDVDYWPQAVPCPHCGDWIMWHEDGYVPGHRSCRNGCKRRWQITMSSGAGRWTMNRIK